MLLGQEGACTQEEARTRDTRRSGQRHHGDVAERQRAQCLHDSTLKSHTSTPPDTLDDYYMLQFLTQLAVFSLHCYARDFEQVSIFGGVAVLMKVSFYTDAAGFVSPLTLAILYGSQYSTLTAVLTEEELDWLQSGVVHRCVRPPQKGRPPVSKRQVKRREGREGREGRLLTSVTAHHPPHFAHDCRSGLQCGRTVMRGLVRHRSRTGWMWRALPPETPWRRFHTARTCSLRGGLCDGWRSGPDQQGLDVLCATAGRHRR